MNKSVAIGFWGTITLIVLVAAATVSLILMFDAGRNQQSILLIALFTGWVLSPFVVQCVVTLMSTRWSATTRTTLYSSMLFLSVGSLVCYSGALSVQGTKPAFMYLMVPLISWVVMVVAFPILRSVERRNKEK